MTIQPFNVANGLSVGEGTELTVITETGNVAANSLTVSGTANLGNVSNVEISGGAAGQVLSTDGSGNLSWTTPSGTGDVGFDGNIIYDLNGVALQNSDLSHGLTSGIDVPPNGSSNALGITNTYGNVKVTAGVSGATTTTIFEGGGNLVVAGAVNSNGASLGSVSNVSITGGNAGEVLSTDGSGNLSWVSSGGIPTEIANGASNVNIPVASGNVVTNVSGNPVLVVAGDGVNVAGTSNVTGAAEFGNGVYVTGIVSASGNVEGGNVNTLGLVYANNLAVGSTANLGDLSNVQIFGGSNGQVISTIGGGVLTWTTPPAAYGNTEVSDFLASGTDTANIVTVGNVVGGNLVGGNLNVTGTANVTSLTVNGGTANLGDLSNVQIYGGTAGQILTTTGGGILAWGSPAGTPTEIANGTSNVTIPTADGNIYAYVNGVYTMKLTPDAIAVGSAAGVIAQGANAVAIGIGSGFRNQGADAIAIGSGSGNRNQGSEAISIGSAAGYWYQGNNAISIGGDDGNEADQGTNAVSIGYNAGMGTQGANSIALGAGAGSNNQPANSIIINATGANLNGSNEGFYVAPVRNDTGNTANAVYFNTSTNEVTYGPAGSLNIEGSDNFISTPIWVDTVGTANTITSYYPYPGSLSVLSVGQVVFMDNIGGSTVAYTISAIAEDPSNPGYTLVTFDTDWTGSYSQPGNQQYLLYDPSVPLPANGKVSVVATDSTLSMLYDPSNQLMSLGTTLEAGFTGGETESIYYPAYYIFGNDGINTMYMSSQYGFSFNDDPTGSIKPGQRLYYYTDIANNITNSAYVQSVNFADVTLFGVDWTANPSLAPESGSNVWVQGVSDSIERIFSWDQSVKISYAGPEKALSLTVGNVPALANNGSSLELTTTSVVATLAGSANSIINVVDNGSNIAVNLGTDTGAVNQGQYAVAIGTNSGAVNQGSYSVAIGTSAGANGQVGQGIAVGFAAGGVTQGYNSIAIGTQAATNVQGWYSIAIGTGTAYQAQGANAVAIGYNAGTDTQGDYTVALGWKAGANLQAANAVAIGYQAGSNSQSVGAIAIGVNSGNVTQGANSVAIGTSAGSNAHGAGAIAIGYQAGFDRQGANSIAIGLGAGASQQVANSIIINASGSNLNANTNAGFYVNPVRNDTGNIINSVYYNTTTKELTYASGNIALGANVTAGQNGTKLYFYYDGNAIASIDSGGNLICAGNVTAFGTP